MTVQGETSLLDITPYLKEDFGEYECRVRNVYGSSKMKVSLKEIGKKEYHNVPMSMIRKQQGSYNKEP